MTIERHTAPEGTACPPLALDEEALSARLRELEALRDAADHEMASRVAPYADEESVAEATAALVSGGYRIFQPFKLADNDRDHVAKLLELFAPPPGAVVLDAGCGIGTVAEMMHDARPDLEFVLLNVSRTQLDLCPEGFRKLCGSFDAIPLPAASVDAVLLAYALGYGLLDRVMPEAVRVLKPGGVIFIYDMAAEDSARLIVTLGYKAHAQRRVLDTAARLGLSLDLCQRPTQTVSREIVAVMGEAAFRKTFAGVAPVAYRFVK